MALDTFNPYLFVSAGEQSNKFLTPNYADGIAKFQAQRAQQVNKLLVQIDPVQDLNGQANPYPPGGGKNLLNFTGESGLNSGVTWTFANGIITTSGTATANVDIAAMVDTSSSGLFNTPGSYILSGCPSGGSGTTYALSIRIYDGSTNRYISDTGTGAAFTLASGECITRIYGSVKSGTNMNGKVFYPMIRLASVSDGTYAPYSNICPISGRTGMTVTAAGTNLLPMPITSGSYDNGVTVTVNADKSFYFSKPNSTNWTSFYLGIFTLPAGSYTLIEGDDSAANASLSLRYEGTDTIIVQTRYSKRQTFTLTETTSVDARFSRATEATNVLTKLMLFAGTTATAADYKAYNSTTYPISWQTEAGTIYGGTLNVTTGVLTVDKYFLTCADTITPNVGEYAYSTNPNRWQIPLSGDYMPSNEKMGESISDTFGYYDGGFSQWPDGTFRFSSISNNQRFIQFKWAGQPTTVEDLKTLLAENPIHFVIPLATPTTYQLDPEEVQTLAGYNQIYSDAGPVIDIQF